VAWIVTDPLLESLAREARAGDDDAFRTLVGKIYRSIYRWALVRTGDVDDAEDVTQEVLIRIHRHLEAWEGRGSVLTWVYRITMNEAVSLERRRGPTRSADREPSRDTGAGERAASPEPSGGWGESGTTDALDRLESRRAAALVLRHLNELPPAQRQAFQLVDVEGLRAVDAADLLEVSSATVRVHLHRARATIRRRVLDEHPELAEERG
jgi:RNA polymerase sigma-70 factor, ECF subfamily